MLSDMRIELNHFSKRYGSGSKSVAACTDISFCAQSGAVTGLLGPNGAGKSTMLKALSGAIYPTAGTVTLGTSSDARYIRQHTGFVPETPELDGTLTVKETLTEASTLYGQSTALAQQSVEQAVSLCSLEAVLDKKVGTLSKGFLQRTSFARALSYNPSVFILDEISSGLDPAQIVQIHEVIKRIAREKIVILSTHHIEEASSLCARLYIISGGRIAACGTEQEINDQTKQQCLEDAFLFLTKSNDTGGAS